jgi:hypothetical protein
MQCAENKNLFKSALNLLPLVTYQEIGPIELLNWGSGECAKSNSGVEFSFPVVSRDIGRGSVPNICCLAKTTSVYLRTIALFLLANCRQPAVLHLRSECHGAVSRHA